jgi:glycosyltransferase involved in cell wall biosynthesis
MMHVAINAHLLAAGNSYRQAGIHRYIYNVLTHLPALDETLAYTVFLNHPLDQSLPRLHQQKGMFSTSSSLKRILWEQLVQPFALQRLKPALYHAMAFVMPRGVPCPSVVTVYDLSFERYPQVLSGLRRRYLQMFTRVSCQRATRIIAISESTANDIVDLWAISREKIDVAPPGLSPEFRPLAEELVEGFRHRTQLPRRFLLFLGTLEPRKNLPMLIRAYAALPKSMREEVHLVLGGGKGWLYNDIFATITQHGLEDKVHLPGYIPPEDLVLWYNAADGFVYPALYEGFGMPIVEALACGKSVLVSRSSSLPEAAGDLGILLPPNDEAAWRDAMRHLIEHPERQAAIRPRALAWAREFTWERTATRTLESYYRAWA